MQCWESINIFTLSRSPEVQAILAFNDLIAIGAMQACLELGRKIPQDIKIIGFDDIPMAAFVTPALTTFSYPKKEIGALALTILIALLEWRTNPGGPLCFSTKNDFAPNNLKHFFHS